MKLQLRHLRRMRDLTQSELANRIGKTLRVVSSWEREETLLPLEDACAIADVLECTLDELAGRVWTGGEDAAERELVECYRDAPRASQELILHTARVGRGSGQALNSGLQDAEGIA